MSRVRITFSKQGALRYTGHLDLHRLWERAARRAELPLSYSQGFHPQPRISLASALPLGFSSQAELLDMRLNEDIPSEEIMVRLRQNLPSGIQVLNIESVEEHAPALQTQVASAEYQVTLTEPVDRSELERRVDELLAAESLPRERRGKPYDLRPLIEEISLTPAPLPMGEGLFMRLAAREGATGRPEEVIDALGIPADLARVERIRLIFSE
ncbi:MAG: TIGR03936 family radical SAM-associated protein [Chloroflexota bacterium]